MHACILAGHTQQRFRGNCSLYQRYNCYSAPAGNPLGLDNHHYSGVLFPTLSVRLCVRRLRRRVWQSSTVRRVGMPLLWAWLAQTGLAHQAMQPLAEGWGCRLTDSMGWAHQARRRWRRGGWGSASVFAAQRCRRLQGASANPPLLPPPADRCTRPPPQGKGTVSGKGGDRGAVSQCPIYA